MSIHLERLQFAYPKHPLLIDIEQWRVAKQESVLLLGPSGSGKSTLLNLLAGLLKPDSGTLQLCGQEMTGLSQRRSDRFRAEHLGFIFQQFNLIAYLSAIDNIMLAASFSKQSLDRNTLQTTVEQSLVDLNIDASLWHKPASQLSIGQQQRVAIARALINQPEILIADEPTSALDTDNRDAFISMLIELSTQRQMSLVFVSHDSALAKHFDRVDRINEINRVVS